MAKPKPKPQRKADISGGGGVIGMAVRLALGKKAGKDTPATPPPNRRKK